MYYFKSSPFNFSHAELSQLIKANEGLYITIHEATELRDLLYTNEKKNNDIFFHFLCNKEMEKIASLHNFDLNHNHAFLFKTGFASLVEKYTEDNITYNWIPNM